MAPSGVGSSRLVLNEVRVASKDERSLELIGRSDKFVEFSIWDQPEVRPGLIGVRLARERFRMGVDEEDVA